MRIHVTDRRQWKRCRRKYAFAQEGLLPSRGHAGGALWFGKGIHHCLEAHYRKDDAVTFAKYSAETLKELDITPENMDKILESSTLAHAMITGYKEWAETADQGLEVVEVEKEFAVRVPGTKVDLVGKVDLIVKDTYNNLWILDHKTCKSFSSDAEIEMDDQLTAYLWLVRQAGLKVKGAGLNMLRKKIPAEVPILQSGKPSRNASLDTSVEKYIAAIYACGENPEDYVDMIEILAPKEFFHRSMIIKSKRNLDLFEDTLRNEVREMTSKKTKVYPNHTFMCMNDCSYVSLCNCMDDGGDVEFLKRLEYVHEEVRK